MPQLVVGGSRTSPGTQLWESFRCDHLIDPTYIIAVDLAPGAFDYRRLSGFDVDTSYEIPVGTATAQ